MENVSKRLQGRHRFWGYLCSISEGGNKFVGKRVLGFGKRVQDLTYQGSDIGIGATEICLTLRYMDVRAFQGDWVSLIVQINRRHR